jgi:hypothetical protein
MGTALLLLAGPLLAFCAFFAFIYPQTPVRMARSTARLIDQFGLWALIVDAGLPVPRSQMALAITILVAVVGAFIGYALAIRVTWNRPGKRLSLTTAVAVATVCFAVSAWALPTYNSDIYQYIASGQVAALHHANPYTTPVDAFPDSPIYQFTSKEYTDIPGDDKPAAWLLLATGLAKIGGADPVGSILVFRGAFLLTNLACLGLVILLLRDLAPQRRLTGVIAYGWNPVVVTQGQSKVDTVMVLFFLLGTALIIRHRPRLAGVTLTISAMVKFITLPLIAIWWLRNLRGRGTRVAAGHAAVMALTAAVILVPFWHGPDLIRQQVDLLAREGHSLPGALRLVATLAFVVLLLVVGLSRGYDDRRLIRAWTMAALFFALFVTQFDHSWYLMTVIAVVSIHPTRNILALVGAASLASLFLNEWRSVSSGSFPLLGLSTVPTFILYLGPAAVAGIVLLWIRSQRRMAAAPSG